MRHLERCTSVAVVAACCLALAMATAAVASEPIHRGVDVWMTVAGQAHTSLSQDPIPAGFFCQDSRPFSGVITMRGVPLAVTPGKGLGGIDTVVRRLDDAVFNEKGEAQTRIQLMALSLASTAPIETSCGRYDVAVSLAPGEQPVTTMRIFRTETLGGTYSAPLALNVRITFTPVNGDQAGRRELTRRIDLGPANRSVWAYVSTPRYLDGARIDTTGSGHPNTALPKASNFQAGVQPAVLKGQTGTVAKVQLGFPGQPTACEVVEPGPPEDFTCPAGQCPYSTCHCDPNGTNPYESNSGCDHLHCIWVCVAAPGS